MTINKLDYKQYIDNGYHVFPTGKDKAPVEVSYGSFCAALKWMQPRDAGQMRGLFDRTHFGIGLGLGTRFHSIGCIDIDNKIGNTDRILEVIATRAGSLFSALTVNATGGKGYHLIYKCKHLEGSRKLTYMADFTDGLYKCVIETKEQNSYIVVPPSPGYRTLQGDMLDIQWITPKERASLMAICLGLNEKPPEKAYRPLGGAVSSAAGTYAQELLEHHGWAFFGHKYVRRPGKKRGTSGTFGYVRDYTLYIFSTDADIRPFQDGIAYGPLDIVALLDFDGDTAEAKRFFKLKNWTR